MSDTIAIDLVAAANDIGQLVPWNASLDDHQCEAGAKPARRIIERAPSTKGDAP